MTKFSGISSGACCSAWGCMATCWVLSSPCMMALCCLCGSVVGVAQARAHPSASDRAAHSVPPSSAYSLFGLHRHLQTTAPAAGVQIRHLRLSKQTWTMLIISASWPAAQSTSKPSLTLWPSTVLHYTWRLTDGGLRAVCQITSNGHCFHVQWPHSGVC